MGEYVSSIYSSKFQRTWLISGRSFFQFLFYADLSIVGFVLSKISLAKWTEPLSNAPNFCSQQV